MGYYSTLSGEITFSRALNKREADAVGAAQDSNWDYYALVTETEERETDEGLLTIWRTTGLKIMDGRESDVKAYEWENTLRAMLEALPEGVTASGYFERVGEESPDMERLYVNGRYPTSVKPVIVWELPDGTTEQESGGR